MRDQVSVFKMAGALAMGCALALLTPRVVFAHCDTLDGPVVKGAEAALAKGDVTPVLKWVRKEQEGEIRQAFKETLVVRSKGPEARKLADRYFFETLVRVHRAGEGAPYTGLKPAGTDLEPAVLAADKALETGAIDSLVKLVTESVAAGIRQRFVHALGLKKYSDESIKAGREFVEAYVGFVHYVERLHLDATASAGHQHETAEVQEAEHHGQ